MEDNKKKIIILVSFFLIMGMVWLFNTDKYIYKNIRIIDKADSFKLVSQDNIESYPFHEEFYKIVSYGGFIIESDNFSQQLTRPYMNELTKLDIKIEYFKGESKLATADIYQGNDNSKYIIYMNNVYWETGAKLIDLLELIE